jgi:Bacteriophage HK97-gp10, putative tail-component
MSVNLFLDGIDELRKALRDMPDDLTNDAIAIVATAAEDAASELRSVYPNGPMRDGVVVTDRSQLHQAKFTVESRTDQAVWWEFGTQNRTTQKGWNRGAEPAHKDRGLVTIARKHRVTMRAALIALVQSAGFMVTEDLSG